MERMYSKWTARVLLTLALLLAGCASAPPRLKKHVGGEELALEDLRGRVVLLNFWANWCKPCLLEIPELMKASERHGDQVVFVAAYYQFEAWHRASVDEWLKQVPESFSSKVAWGNGALLRQFPHRAIPTTYVLGRNGEVIESFTGAILDEKDKAALEAAIQRGLGNPTPPAPMPAGNSTVEEVEEPAN